MLLIILLIVLAVVGGVIIWLYSNSYKGFWDHEAWVDVGMLFAAVGLVGSIACGAMVLKVQVKKDVDYQAALNERTALEYRLEHRAENQIGNEMLYSEITEFNNSLLVAKKWANNPWVGCFNNDLIADLDYIEYKEERE